MPIYHVNNSGDDGVGSFEDPFNNISNHVATLAPNDLMYIHGDVGSHRIYTESPIICNNNGSATYPITIRPYPGTLVTLKTAGTPAWNSTLTINGDYWIFAFDGLMFDKDHEIGWQITVDTASHVQLLNAILTQAGGTAAIRFLLAGSSSDFIIDGLTIYDTDYGLTDAHGIVISGTTTREVTIRNTDIYDCRGDCVHVYLGTGDITIEDSNLYTTLGKCSENGLDAKMGTVIMRGCKLHGFRYCDGTCGGSGGGIGAAIIGHQEIVSLTVEDTEIYDCTSGINLSSNSATCRIGRNLIRDLVTDATTWLNAAIYCHAQGGNTVEIFKNTIYECPQHLYRFDATADVDIQNNIHCQTHTIEVLAGATTTYNNNGWFGCDDTLSGANDVTGADPGFVDAANDNYHLASGSACIDAGVDVGGYDYIGTDPDLGCYEYQPTASVICMIM
jgi:hypothetical protein